MALSDFQRLVQFFGQAIAIATVVAVRLLRLSPVSSGFLALRSLGLESLPTINPAKFVAIIAQPVGLK